MKLRIDSATRKIASSQPIWWMCRTSAKSLKILVATAHDLSCALLAITPFLSRSASVWARARWRAHDKTKHKCLNNPKKFWRFSTPQYPATWRSFLRLVHTFQTLITFFELSSRFLHHFFGIFIPTVGKKSRIFHAKCASNVHRPALV